MRSSSRRISSGKVWLTSAVGAIAALTVAGTAFTAEAPNKDEVFTATSLVTGLGSQHISSFDISFVDPEATYSGKTGLYLLADRTNKAIDVIDTGSNALIHQFTGFTGFSSSTGNDVAGPNGVFTVNHRFVWAGDGNSTFQVIDLTGADATKIVTVPGGAKRTDEGCWDSRDNIVLWANDAESPSPFITFWDSTNATQIGSAIAMNGSGGAPNATNGIEQCQWSPVTGKFYLNIPQVGGQGNDETAGAVLVINPKTRMIEKTWTIDYNKCAGPQGMALGPNNQILLGCNAASGNGKFSTVIINQHTGAVIRVLDDEQGADEVWYNPGDGHYFLGRSKVHPTLDANPTGNSMLGVVDSTGKREDQSAVTGKPGAGAHSVAANPSQPYQAYVPIPANGEITAGQGVCALNGGDDTHGCIAVFTTTNDDRSRFARERDGDDNQQ